MEFSKILKEQRTKRGLSQEQLADDLRIARQSVSKWERGEAYPSIGMLIKLSDFFDISIDKLLKGDDHLRREIVKDGEKITHPKLKLFFDWLFLTGAAFLLVRIALVVLTKAGIVEWEISFLQGWLPSVATLALMLIGGVGSDELKKNVK